MTNVGFNRRLTTRTTPDKLTVLRERTAGVRACSALPSRPGHLKVESISRSGVFDDEIDLTSISNLHSEDI